MKPYTQAFRDLLHKHERELLLGSEMDATFADWEKERAFLSKPITKPGKILDFGCANGLLLRTLQEWTGFGEDLIPYGVDSNTEHIKDAQELFSKQKSHFYTSDQFFQGPFDYVFWNVWDNLQVSADNNSRFNAYFRRLLEITKRHGLLILAFYQANEQATMTKIAHIISLLLAEDLKYEVLANEHGVQKALVIKK
jgi:SAM-dependent methyltransferase